ncbi:flavin reductase family protein [Fusobacterium massiliense]|jgi:possible flavin reductase|uniref:flavin reductase family protein n=1 Tax=Fusobacterium massiliense TaxID=1852365 RepID=UPI000938E502|nr:flavin reductase family protein [Fusobacterium massiliense]
MKKRYLKGSVILNPVPVVLITCRNLEGKENIFTVAWIGTVCSKPPMLSISIRPERLSYDYIKETMEFTVNIPNRKLTKITDFCGVRSGRQINKIEEMNLTMVKGSEIETSFIEECPISIECKVKEIIKLGSHDMFIAEVLCSHINEDLFDEKDKIDLTKADLIAYSHGEYFSVDKNPLGKFGYSVMKKKKKKIKNK